MKKIKIKDLKKGDYFTLKEIEYPDEKQVYIKGDYERSEKKYSVYKFYDVNSERLLKGEKEVYIGFTF